MMNSVLVYRGENPTYLCSFEKIHFCVCMLAVITKMRTSVTSADKV